MRKKLEALINSGLPAFRVAREAGVPHNTVARLFSGESSLDNIRFNLAEKLNNYWEEHHMWKTVQSDLFNVVRVGHIDGGMRVYVKASDNEGETFVYVHIIDNEAGDTVPGRCVVAENFEYFNEEQKAALRALALAEAKIAAEKIEKELAQM